MAFQYGQQVDSNGTIIHTGFWGVGSIFSTVTLPQIIENFRAIGEDGAILAVHDASKVTSGIFDIARIPAAAIERMTSVVDQSTRYALTTASVQNGDCVLQLDTSIMYWVIDDTNLGNAAGYHQYNAGTAASVPWSGVTGKPATAAGYGILSTDAMFGTILTGYDTIALRNLALGSYATLASSTFTGVTTLPSTTSIGLTTAIELGYVHGVTSAIQTQLTAKAAKGANTDITSLSGLTTALSIGQGGTGAITAAAALAALGGAPINSPIFHGLCVAEDPENLLKQVMFGTVNDTYYIQAVHQQVSLMPFGINPEGGNVGIGVPSPQATLHSAGNTILGCEGLGAIGFNAVGNNQVNIAATGSFLGFSWKDASGNTYVINLTPPTAGGLRVI